MARRMYDLDNGTENIKVKEIVANGHITLAKLKGVNISASSVINFKRGDDYILSLANNRVVCGQPLRLMSYTSESVPLMGGSDAGVVIYNSTLGKVVLYNGTAWVNLDGTVLS